MEGIKKHIESTLNSYSQIFFAENKLFALLLMLVTFFDIGAGICGLTAVITTNAIANLIKFNRNLVSNGLLGFNSLLTGLGLGLYYKPAFELILVTMFASILCLLFTMLIMGFLQKYGLPYLSLPFLFSMWVIALAGKEFHNIGLSERNIYTANQLFSLGGMQMLQVYEWFKALDIPTPISTYFLSLGAIFFQYNLLSGILIAIGLLIYSRIAFSLSVIGYTSAMLFYFIIGADYSTLSYNYIGFNYILASIAIGGYFFIPSFSSYLSVVIMLPITVLITISSDKILSAFNLSIYSLPFNLIVIIFLYSLKFREQLSLRLKETAVQHNHPERNLYFSHNQAGRFKNNLFFPISLPFWGEWRVSQAHNGKITHKNDWRHAWDFIITDDDGKQYKDSGDLHDDYFCFGKNVIAPGYGYVVELIDNIDDNKIGDVNMHQNWGNSIVIQHTELLYSKVSHLKKGSITVNKGDYVTQGQIIGQVGNSGRSPYPHLHFQLQTTPSIGSKTLDYPLYNYLKNNKGKYQVQSFDKPLEDDVISNPPNEALLENAFNMVPGQLLEFLVKKDDGNTDELQWEVKTDVYNNTYLYCNKTNSSAYFYNNRTIHYFTDFVGDKSSFLFLFQLIFNKVQLGFYKNLTIADHIPSNHLFSKSKLFFQDFIAPFYLYLKTHFRLQYLSVDDDFSPQEIKLHSKIENQIFNKNNLVMEAHIIINKNGFQSIQINYGLITIQAACIPKQYP